MTQITIELGVTTSSHRLAFGSGVGDSDLSSIPARVNRQVPPVTLAGQAYFWTNAWQAGERETDEDLATGNVRRFSNARDAIRYLLSADE
jgi:hypothetical protein